MAGEAEGQKAAEKHEANTEQKPVEEQKQEGQSDAANGSESKVVESKEANGDAAETSKEDKDSNDKETDDKDELKTRNWREKADEDNQRNGGGRGRGGGGRGRGGDGHSNRGGGKSQSKANYDNIPESDDPDEIRTQVEFYFSDSNLLSDKFLLTQIGGHKNNPVPIKTIHGFKRMRHFQPYSAVVKALKDSKTLDVTDKEEIVRKTPLPEDTSEDIRVNVKLYDDMTRSRSIYAKGFGEESESTQLDIENFFAPYGPINSVRLRRDHVDRFFKGSAFVEFQNDELAKSFLDLDLKPKFKDQELKIMSKEAYVNQKADDIKAGKIRPNEDRPYNQRGGGRGRGGYGNRGSRGGRGGRGGGRGDGRGGRSRDQDDRDHKPQSPESKKRSAPDDGEQGEAKKSKADDE